MLSKPVLRRPAGRVRAMTKAETPSDGRQAIWILLSYGAVITVFLVLWQMF